MEQSQNKKYPDLPETQKVETFVDDEHCTIGYYVRGHWAIDTVIDAVYEEYSCDREDYEHAYFRFVPGGEDEPMWIKTEKEPKQGNFPVTYCWD